MLLLGLQVGQKAIYGRGHCSRWRQTRLSGPRQRGTRQRERRRMTIASLARKVGVSAAAISQIESGAVQPSVATLRKLAASLEIPVFRLFLPVESEAVKVVWHTDRITIGRPWSGARYQLLSPSVQGQLEVMEVSMDPGQDSARELLSHAREECLVVITGRGALEFSDAVIDLRAGDAATFQGSIPHRLRNIGRRRLTVLSSSSRRRSDGEPRDRRPIQGQLQRQTSGSRPAVLGLTGDIAPKPAGRETVMPDKPTIVLVHGAFADASSWSRVIPGWSARASRPRRPPTPCAA